MSALTAQKRILIADDNEAVRVMLEDILGEAGYPVTAVTDGLETREILEKEKFDLVVLDLLMPQKSGFEILEWLNSRAEKPIVLVLTGIFRSPKEIERLRQLGAKGYIYKSAPVEEILYRVNKVLFPDDQDTRKYPRIPVNIPVEYNVDGKWAQAYCSTMGVNGLFIRTVNPSAVGKKITVKFSISESAVRIVAEGSVVWSNEYDATSKKSSLPGMGVEFRDVKEEDHKELARFIEDQLGKDLMW